ncbi:protein FAM136A-like [Montipora capricornis]|uniref:protein FAM136A-like n=1 Tax=Montipora capricornis TaxID=246305 RepID=UPI0035F1F64F
MATSAAQARIKEEVERSIEKLERDHLRGLQAKSHLCAAKCCDNLAASKEEVQQCMNQCFMPVQQIQEYLGKELTGFQDRISRCAQHCQDRIQDNVDPNTTQSELAKFQGELNTCVDQCCKTHIELVPKMFEKMKKVLSQVKEPAPR